MIIESILLGWALGLPALAVNSKNLDDGSGGQGYAPQPYYPPQPQYAPQHGQQAYGGYRATIEQSDGVVLNADSRGHFHAAAVIDGVPARGMIDSGASFVVVSHAWARALGIDVRRLRYDRPISTANGTTYGFAFMIPDLVVEGLVTRNVEALVLQQGGSGSNLIGASFLGRLSSVETRGNTMILRP